MFLSFTLFAYAQTADLSNRYSIGGQFRLSSTYIENVYAHNIDVIHKCDKNLTIYWFGKKL